MNHLPEGPGSSRQTQISRTDPAKGSSLTVTSGWGGQLKLLAEAKRTKDVH